MTGAGGDPPAGGGHAWERLREQRARDLGEPTPDPGEPPDESAPEDETDEEAENDQAENDRQGK
jgi:hypothetical protein